ncbi:MAG: gliding motility-associated C-terminal domain-containing protein [Bacteroidia bacterium]|nr:gliding motility-associated C-terminal domain-containing protein [Bacteroidia bacterium]
MSRKVLLLFLQSGFVLGQYQYEIFFQQAYVRSGNLQTPDSLDIYIRTRQSSGGGVPDTLASANFPFFFNNLALLFSQARVIFLRKFHDNSYYLPISYNISGNSVNLTIRRRIGFTPPGHALVQQDTLIGWRVPLLSCGSSVLSALVWDSTPAAVLNSRLQNLKQRLSWRNDTLLLCPSFSISTFNFSPPPSTICENRPSSWIFSVSGSLVPDSFVVSVRQITPPSPPILYPDIVTTSGGGYAFELTFLTSGRYEIGVVGVDRKCLCERPLGSLQAEVAPLPPLLGIQGRDTVYAGSVATYSLSQSPTSANWVWIEGTTTTPLGSGTSKTIAFTNNPPLPRVDTILVDYTTSGSSCLQRSFKLITVLPCPSGGGNIQPASLTICAGQSVTLELQGFSTPIDSLHWQIWTGSSWADVTDGIGMRTPVYSSPPLTGSSARFRVRLHYGNCTLFSPSAQIQIEQPPPLRFISGPSYVYPGTYTYTLTGSGTATWTYAPQGGSSSAVGTGNSVIVTFPPSLTDRVDTLIATYGPESCPKNAYYHVYVNPCPTIAIDASAETVCLGQIVELSVTGAFVYDTLHWQKQVGEEWMVVDSMRLWYNTPDSLPLGDHVYRVRLRVGLCEVYSSPVTITISGEFLRRELYILPPSEVCIEDTLYLYAEGRGIWTTPNGRGIFTQPESPQTAYIPALADTAEEVRFCWVIRPEDLTACRDKSKDTLCTWVRFRPIDAQGAFSIPSEEKRVCLGGRLRLRGEIISGSFAGWETDGEGIIGPDPFSTEAYYIPDSADVGKWIRFAWTVIGQSCGSQIYIDSAYVEAGLPIRILAPNRVCSNVSLTLAAAPLLDDILWFRGGVNTILTSGGFSEANPRFLARGGFYEAGILPVGRDTFTAYLRRGTCESIDELPVEVAQAPQVSFEAAPRVTTMNNPRVVFTLQAEGATSYTWDFGDYTRITTDSSQRQIEHIYSEPGIYSVVVYAENREIGCANFYVCTNCIEIVPRRIFLPNAFSPNGDGINDVFRVLPLEEGLRFDRLEIFDRWGQLVFAGDEILEWRGEGRNGEPLDPGIYSYRALIRTDYEKVFTYTGVVHLLR